MVKGEVTFCPAILAAKFIPQKQIKAREGHALLRFYIVFEDNDGGDPDHRGGAAHHFVIFGDDIHPIQPRRFDGFLPRPKRQRVVTEGSIVGVEHQCGVLLEACRVALKVCPKRTVHMPYLCSARRLGQMWHTRLCEPLYIVASIGQAS